MFSFKKTKNKTVIITGSSRGIGREIALVFLENEYNIIINYKKSKKETLELVDFMKDEIIKKKYGNCVMAVKADISKFNECEFLFDEILKKFGSIEVLVNNAGISLYKIFQDVTESEALEIFNVNLFGTLNCSKLAVQDMIKYKSGSIINISSMWGIHGSSMEVHYSASKAAIIGFTKSLAKELAPSNIFVNCIAPGVIDTDMNKKLNIQERKELENSIPLKRFGNPREIANLAFFLAQNNHFITGQVINPDGGMFI